MSPRLHATAAPPEVETVAAEPLELFGVRAGYGRIEVLHGIDLAVRRGTLTALLGPNGAGKTTALGVMSGLITRPPEVPKSRV